ncbi:hypothetical protein HNR44_001345 [Geomicrobium halophilum]|uniref:Uncharacterized protein n=1 Tax=Geomicrobium halophilum TaxID=549000 RepID=A0A841PQD6_9BACL|nr:hypothetical protein [Geomicrobium halophilum]
MGKRILGYFVKEDVQKFRVHRLASVLLTYKTIRFASRKRPLLLRGVYDCS